MDAVDSDWKKKVGFPINYDSEQSSDDETNDVVMRHPRRSSRFLLADGGNGAEADELGTTPPRSRIRNKEKRRTYMDASSAGFQRSLKRDSVDHPLGPEVITPVSDRLKKRSSLKLIRSKERDWKQDMSQRDSKADSLPSPNPLPAVPTLVESCSRFMSLTSRPKCREASADKSADLVEERWRDRDEELPPSRVNFHKTFCMLINMGNIEKGCKRTISREEQVWQNELKDLIWLELQAKVGGRTLAQQDAFLCAQRNVVPAIVTNIFEYRFVNDNPCRGQSKQVDTLGSGDNVSPNHQDDKDAEKKRDDNDPVYGCLTFDCHLCSEAVGKAMREVGNLLDSFYNAVSLYPSSKAMTVEHPLIATQLFKSRLKAMCLWFNTALNMRLKMVSMRRVLRSLRLTSQRRALLHRASTDSDASRHSLENQKVHFNLSSNPTDSSNSESSAQSIKEESDKDLEKETDVPRDSTKESEKEIAAHGRTEDELDSGHTGQITPEIVISDRSGPSGASATSGTSDSSESYTSESAAPADAFDIGPLYELTQLSLLNKCRVSLYREHHREILKTQGVRRCMMFVSKMRTNILHKVYLTLEKPDSIISDNETEDDPVEVFEESKNYEDRDEGQGDDDDDRKTYELRRYGCWSEESLAMRLPSYRSHFLLLSSICMEAVHDYLSLRLEARPDQPSCLTVKQLIHELKEGLDISTEMRADFVRNLQAALAGRAPGAAAADLLLLVRTFDATVETVLKLYLSYLTTMSEKERMSRAALQAEWSFTARLAKRVRCAALLAPTTFSNIACNQLNKLLKQYQDKFGQLMEDEDIDRTDPNRLAHRHTVYALCRSAQGIFAGEREATLAAAAWARALAARLARAPPPAHLRQRARIFNALMSIRDFIVKQVEMILEHSRSPPTEEMLSWEHPDAVMTRVRELLLQVCKLGFELHKELYKFAHAPFQLLEERVARRRRPASLQPPARAPPPAPRRRPGTVLVHASLDPVLIHKELHRFVNDPAPNRSSLSARRSVTSPSRGSAFARAKYMRSDSVVEDNEASVFDDRLFDLNNFGECQTQTSIELLLSGQQPAAEQQVELRSGASGASAVSGEEKQWAARVARAVIEFARCWMQFVVERCERGRGLRPRWASQGLEFLMLACDPCNTKHLSDEEFEELKQLMDRCISHVIGSHSAPARADSAASSPSPRVRHRLHSPLSSSAAGREVPAPPTPPGEPEPLLCFPGADVTEGAALRRLERARDQLLRSRKCVGRVLDAAVATYQPKLRQLTFKWQRGLKIGAGTFGKVYTVVNTESGQLLAMKELSIGVNDRRAFQRAANELRVLEGVIHPHLVRYYGCELHREEMLIFMELCVEGSLEALVGTAGALAERAVRVYTKQLLSAVVELHARAIAHRDIKSGNIFLTNEGHCLKLGDFGCAVKIRANTTAPYELQGYVGTQAYMAPEVFMKQSGHGRAADIWSLGCVVTEMASGKRPFSEYDSNYQIMFMVGSGARPPAPDSLSREGRDFCRACLTHDCDARPRADRLAEHSFLMIKSDDDCKCEPAYLIT